MSEAKKPINLGDVESVRERNEQVKRDRAQELADLRSILALPAGQRFLERLIVHCGVHHDGWTPSAEIHKNAGVKSVGLFVVREMLAADDVAGGVVLVKAHKRKGGTTQ